MVKVGDTRIYQRLFYALFSVSFALLRVKEKYNLEVKTMTIRPP